MEYIEIDKDAIPYKFELTLIDETYTFYINHNYLHNFLTVDLYRNDEVIVLGEKIVYGEPLLNRLKYRDIPNIKIIPLDPTGVEDTVTFENINEEVFLIIQGDSI